MKTTPKAESDFGFMVSHESTDAFENNLRCALQHEANGAKQQNVILMEIARSLDLIAQALITRAATSIEESSPVAQQPE